MNIRRGSRAAVAAILVMGASLGLVSGKASAEPRVCGTLDHNIQEEQGWAGYYDLQADGYWKQGDTEDAQFALAMARVFYTLVANDLMLEDKMDC